MSKEIIDTKTIPTEESLYSDVCQMIDGARTKIATYLNTEVCMTKWYVGCV